MDSAVMLPDAVISFRLKRMKSILAKIRRPGKDYQIGTMDDIGGCRMVLKDMRQVNEAVGILSERFTLKGGRSVKDYIHRPRNSGYRSYHLITLNQGADREYRVEVQVRTQLQHLWSTAVEAAGVIYEIDLKAERDLLDVSELERQIRIFFTIVSSLFSLEEGTPQVPGYEKAREDLIREMHELDLLKSIVEDLSSVGDDVFLSENGTRYDQAGFYLMRFATEMQFLDIGYYSPRHLEKALRDYDECEGDALATGKTASLFHYDDVVLAYANDGEQLGLAFPNYSTKVGEFLEHVEPYI